MEATAPPHDAGAPTHAPHKMSGISTTTTQRQLEKIAQALCLIENAVANAAAVGPLAKQIAAVRQNIDAFEQAPRALDGHLQQFVPRIASLYFLAKRNTCDARDWEPIADALADLVYVLAKVRGYKAVANALPSDVYTLPRLVELAESPTTRQRPSECYFLLLWLSRLVLVPFPLASVQEGLDTRLSQLSAAFLALHRTALKSQLVALVLLALLVTRPDCGVLLEEYTDAVVVDWPVLDENARLGHLMALNQVLKRATRAPLARLARAVHRGVILHEVALARHGPRGHTLNTMNALYLLKVAAKCARFFAAQAEYESVALLVNSTADLMHHMGELFDAALRECMAKNLAKTTSCLAARAVNYAAQVVAYMLGQLRLEHVEAGDGFVAHVLISPAVLSVPRYHTVLLYLGFLALTKSLPSDFVPVVFSLAHRTCFVSKRNYAFVQSAQLRDASCFCLWAVLRLLPLAHFRQLLRRYPQLVPTVFCDLIRVSLFDEDFTIRRCGIAVLQELVGRFGSVFMGGLVGTSDADKIGEFTIVFIEQFGAATVGSLADSHVLVRQLENMGFLREWFVAPLLDEVLAELSSFELQKLGLVCLAQTLKGGGDTKVQLSVEKDVVVPHIVGLLLESMRQGSHGALYALAELEHGGMLGPETTAAVASHVEHLALDRHGAAAYMGESVMRWLNRTTPGTRNHAAAHMESLLVEISKLGASPSLVHELETFHTLVPTLSSEWFAHLCVQIRHGNRLVAASVMSASLSSHQVRLVGALLVDTFVDAEVRAMLVSKLDPKRMAPPDFALLRPVVLLLLDDYTVTEQGDVGLKVRLACVHLVGAHTRLFHSDAPVLHEKLLRLAGETIDRLRAAAFGVLGQMYGDTRPEVHVVRNGGDYDAYFGDLFAFFTTKCSSQPNLVVAFWSGLVHSSAAATGANTMVNLAFHHVLVYLRDAAAWEQTFVVLVGLLKVAPGVKVLALDRRAQKTIQVTMSLMVKILDAALEVPRLGAETLFVRAYNLHINTAAVPRIALAIRVFQHIGTAVTAASDLRTRCRKRLCWLCCFHSNGQVRALAADALFETASSEGADPQDVQVLDSVSWETARPNATIAGQLEGMFCYS